MTLSSKAELLLVALDRIGGGAIEENILLRHAGISHGSLSAARRELVELGAVILTREGRKAAYRLTEKAEKWLAEKFPLNRRRGTKATNGTAPPEASTVTASADGQPCFDGQSDNLAKKPPNAPKTHFSRAPIPTAGPTRKNAPQGKMTVKKTAGEMATFKVAAMPRVTGDFADRDDWEDNLTARIGGSVDVDEEDDGVYRVHSADFDEDAVYYATEDEDGFHVS